jgi:peptidoglycan/LPS O-acetylase OafA/YrhL
MIQDQSARTWNGLSVSQSVFLDLVRALAASAVLVHHIFLLIGRPELSHGVPLGSLGVSVFFLLSGFLIDQSAQRRAAREYALRDFLADRAARIYVCYVPALIFTALLVAPLCERADFIGKPYFGVWQFLGNLCMLQDYPAFQLARRLGFDPGWFIHSYALAEPYWTVSIELFLYVAFGVVYFWWVKRAATPHFTLLCAAAVAALPVIYHAATGYGGCLTLTWLLGVAGSRLMNTRLAVPSLRFVAAWTGAATLMLAFRILSRGIGFYDLQSALFLGMLLMSGLWLSRRSAWLRLGLFKEAAAFFARTSYPLYLTHNVLVGWAVMHFGKSLSAFELVLVAVSCHACAFVFYWAFDRHYRLAASWLRHAAPQRAAAPQGVQP